MDTSEIGPFWVPFRRHGGNQQLFTKIISWLREPDRGSDVSNLQSEQEGRRLVNKPT